MGIFPRLRVGLGCGRPLGDNVKGPYLIFVTDVTDGVCGEKLFMWRNSPHVVKWKISPHDKCGETLSHGEISPHYKCGENLSSGKFLHMRKVEKICHVEKFLNMRKVAKILWRNLSAQSTFLQLN